MNKGKLRASSRPPGPRNLQNPDRQNEGSRKFWGSPKRMATAKSQMNDRRQLTVAACVGDYRGPPPADRDLIEATFVTSIEEYGFYATQFTTHDSEMDAVRQRHQVWIVADGPESPNVLKIFSDSVTNLQAAIYTLNQHFHDARLSRDLLNSVIIPQKSSRVTDDTRIRVYPGQRPRISKPFNEPDNMPKTVAALLHELRPHLQTASKCLRSSNSEIRMRVSFALLDDNIFGRGQANLINWDDYAAQVKLYSHQGGLHFSTRFREFRLSNYIINRMLEYDGADDLRLDRKSVKRTHTLYLTMSDERELKVENWASDESALSRAKLGLSSPVSYIDWKVTAPEMIFDWRLHAETWNYESVPKELLRLLETLKLRNGYNEDETNFLQPSAVVVTKDPRHWNHDIYLTRLKTSFIAEFQDSPYVLEIGINQEWEGLNTRAPESKINWQMEFYGKHWDSAMNQVNPVDQRKDFGEGLKNIWVGSDPDLEKRFGNFLEVFLKVQHQVNFLQENEAEDEAEDEAEGEADDEADDKAEDEQAE
ncbi:hypothetical protein MKX08_001571 [Trichoderma sp. CBMAI-0020]|nr:hypothetical protein MKX08_001571 [Trichoderma sp. CBMAI-0020]